MMANSKTSNLLELRKQSLLLLGTYLDCLPGKFVFPDELTDDLLRVVCAQPRRPTTRKPYLGLFRETSIYSLRRKAVEVISTKILTSSDDVIKKFQYDAQLDNLIRKLFNLKSGQLFKGLPFDFKPLTSTQLYTIAPYAEPNQIDRFLPYLELTFSEFSINTPLRKAHFLAQAAHESAEFNYVEEIASGWAYEGREDLGNLVKGYGPKFKGRGLFMITGWFNYDDVGDYFGVSFVDNPKKLAEDEYAVRSAGWFWDREDLNELADEDDFERITKVINGFTNGWDDRLLKTNLAKNIFGV